jgi:transposase
MPKAPPPYPPEFREEAVRLARTSGKSMREIAGDLGVSYETVRTWLKRHDVDDGNAPGIRSAEREELRKLRRENRILREEREILRKAAAYFARETR